MGNAILGALLGGLSGAAGGWLAAIADLFLRQIANRMRVARGAAPLKNETRPRLELFGAVPGAIIGATAATRLAWPATLALAAAAPFAAWICLRIVGELLVRLGGPKMGARD